MLERALCNAIKVVIQRSLMSVPDHIIRVEVSRDWPIADALALASEEGQIHVLVRRPFLIGEFRNLTATVNAGVATAWRNTKPRNYGIVIVGTSTGNLDAGLKDVAVVNRRAFVDEWRLKIHEVLGDHENLKKDEVRELIDELCYFVADGARAPAALDKYITSLYRDPSIKTVCESLWQVGLMSDSRVLDHRMAKVRIRRNQQLVDVLRTSDDPRIDRLLDSAEKRKEQRVRTAARQAIKYRETLDSTLLRDVDLAILEEILRSPSVAPSAPRAMSVFELLNEHHTNAEGVRDCLSRLSSSWKLEEVREAVEEEYSNEERVHIVKLDLSPATAEPATEDDQPHLAFPWTGQDDSEAILAAESGSSSPEGLLPTHVPLTPERLLSAGFAQPEVEAYLEARKAMRIYEPWLERDALWLLLLRDDARKAVRRFIEAWSELARAASELDDSPGFIELVQVLETVQGPLDGEESTWIVLGPLHPFRLDPLLRAAEQTVRRLEDRASVAELGTALQWTLDRCYPAYPTFHRKADTLFLTSSRSLVSYSRKPGHHLPAARDSSGLDRVLRAVDGYSPWLQDSVSILAIDPPQGGGVSRALEQARRRIDNRQLYVFHLATGDDADALDTGFGGEIRYLARVPTLSEAKDLPPVNVILRFVSETPGTGEAAGAHWQATKGSHLALEIGDTLSGPFQKTPSTRIKMDPRAGNIVVRRAHDLYARFRGGRPVLATIRPMLQTDDAPVLSRLAASTDWLIFAVPGPLGLVSPRTINNTLRFVGRANMGHYGLYVYAADDLFPVRRHFESFFRKTPVATVPADQMVDLLVTKAQESGNAVLFASLGGVPSHIAALVALEIAKEDAGPDDHVFVLSLDDMGWTRAWLPEGLRADFLVAIVRSDGEILLRVVESKSKEHGEPVPCDPEQEPYKEALNQVFASLNAIREIATASSPSLDEDLRFASLIEHLMAAVLSRTDEIKGEDRKRVFDSINALSRRERSPRFEGLAVLTQTGVNKTREVRRVDEGVRIVSACAPDIARTFGVEERTYSSNESALQLPVLVEPAELCKESADVNNHVLVREAAEGEGTLQLTLAKRFIAAARIHGIAVDHADPVYIESGPSLFSVGILLREGASIQPLRSRLTDIARDIGLGDRAQEIDVENDEKPRTVRVLLPRPDRQFPVLPKRQDALVSEAGYLPIYIGQTVNGKDYAVPIEAWPHMLVAGTTGSGKTTFIKAILRQLAAVGSDKLQAIVVDGKGDTDYLGLLPREMYPAAFPDVQLGADMAIRVLEWAMEEMEARRQKIVDLARSNPAPHGVKATDLYRRALKENRVPEITPLILVIDEFADIMLASRKSADAFENLVQRVSQVGRSRLIHLILATQRPDKETIRGAIKANLNARAVFRLPTQADSLTVLGQAGAERLMLHGDMLFQHGTGSLLRLQAYRV